MNREDKKREYDKNVVHARAAALHAFNVAGFDEAEDMAQEVAARLAGLRIPMTSSPDWEPSSVILAGSVLTKNIAREARSRARGMKLLDIEAARNVPDAANPYHFLIANEIADVAVSLDLDSLMMGDTIADEADHYGGVTRQRAHQIISGLRGQMAEYLTD